MAGKLYAGGEVAFLDLEYGADIGLREEVLQRLEQLYSLMDLPFSTLPPERFNSYVLAHKMGLSFNQEFELLKMGRETDRLYYIKDHLERTVSILGGIDRTRAVIQRNGHFRNFDPLDFKNMEI
jgi:hypothetical protein